MTMGELIWGCKGHREHLGGNEILLHLDSKMLALQENGKRLPRKSRYYFTAVYITAMMSKYKI